MKESTLLEMQNKIKSMTNVIQHLYSEVEYLRTVSLGTLETMKQMSEYDEALSKIKQKIKKDKDGVEQQDTE
jgi:hypothetical protein|tara:strand:+ start:9 stop:224 length:216 start_codon:yes stop_codon:yes gene_type:complete